MAGQGAASPSASCRAGRARQGGPLVSTTLAWLAIPLVGADVTDKRPSDWIRASAARGGSVTVSVRQQRRLTTRPDQTPTLQAATSAQRTRTD
jgi:hypothetical protein